MHVNVFIKMYIYIDCMYIELCYIKYCTLEEMYSIESILSHTD